jgi:hypothetical protein
MAELADALDSGSSGRKTVQVQVLFPAPNKQVQTVVRIIWKGLDLFFVCNILRKRMYTFFNTVHT